MAHSRSLTEALPLILVLILGLLVRLSGIWFGLPDLCHADEPIVVNHAVAYGTGDFNPHFFKVPPLVSYMLFICYGIYYVIGRAIGFFSGLEDFQNLFLSDPSSFYLIGRIVFGALLGTATVYVFYRLVDRFFSRTHAILGSFFLAFAFLHVRDSHYIYCDIPLLLLLVTAYFPIFRILQHDHWKDYLLFGILLGAATATKYNGIFLLFPFATAHFFRLKQLRFRVLYNLFIAALVSFITYSALNPFSWLDFHFFWSELRGQGRSEGFTGLIHHLVYSLNGGLGFPVLVFALGGILISLFSLTAKHLVFLSFVLVYYLVLSFFSQPYDRYVLPLVPFLIFFAADALIYVRQKFNLPKVAWFILALLIASPSIFKVGLSDQLFVQKDIRTVAREWIERNISPNTKIALDIPFYLPRLKPNLNQLIEKRKTVLSAPNPNRAQLKRIDALIQDTQRGRSAMYELFFLRETGVEEKFLFAKPIVPFDLEHLKKMGIEYVMIAQVESKRGSYFYSDLNQKARLVAAFSPYRDKFRQWPIDPLPLTGGAFLLRELMARETNGQIIKIYKIL